MVPAVPARGCDDGCGWVPGAVAHDGFPHAAPAVVVVAVYVSLIAWWTGVLGRGEDVNGFAGVGAVEVPDVDFAVVGAGVDVSPVRRPWRAEVASYKCLQHAVAAECHERAVVWVRAMVVFVVW